MLGTIFVETKERATYSIPDVEEEVIRRFLPETGRVFSSSSSLSIVNVSEACLSIPMRIVKQICFVSVEDTHKKVVLWDCPV